MTTDTTEILPAIIGNKVKIFAKGLNLTVESELEEACLSCQHKSIQASVVKKTVKHPTSYDKAVQYHEVLTFKCCSEYVHIDNMAVDAA